MTAAPVHDHVWAETTTTQDIHRVYVCEVGTCLVVKLESRATGRAWLIQPGEQRTVYGL